MMVKIQPLSAFSYLLQGLHLMTQPGIRRYVWIPLLVNILLFATGFYFIFHRFDAAITALTAWLPNWLDWLTFLIWPFAVLIILFMSSFIFGMITNWIAAPFNGMLAAKVVRYLAADQHPEHEQSIWQEVKQTFIREWQKTKYWLPRALICFALFFIPVVGQLIAPWLWLLFSAWMIAIQYCDYAYDNHKVAFPDMRQQLIQHRWRHLSFGGFVMLLGSIPLINLFLVPLAICAGTAMWVDDQKNKK